MGFVPLCDILERCDNFVTEELLQLRFILLSYKCPRLIIKLFMGLKKFIEKLRYFTESDHFHLNMGIIGFKGSYAFSNEDNE